jgi:hypothetical protein
VYSLAGCQIGSVHGIVVSLILDDSSNNRVQQDVDLISRSLGLQMSLNCGKNDVSERLRVDLTVAIISVKINYLGQNSLSVDEFSMVVHIGACDYQDQS